MKEYFINLFKYDNWANTEVADSVLKINDLQDKIMALMSHIINAQIIWQERINGSAQSVAVWNVYSKEELAKALNKSASELLDFINKTEESDLDRVTEYTNTKEEKFNSAVRDILTHLAVHSSYHRGQIILLLKPLVTVLPYIDYIQYARNVKK